MNFLNGNKNGQINRRAAIKPQSAELGKERVNGGKAPSGQWYGVQAKLKIGPPNDQFEQEADQMADRVMRMPDPEAKPTEKVEGTSLTAVQRKCTDCEGEEKMEEVQTVQKKELSGIRTNGSDAPADDINGKKSLRDNITVQRKIRPLKSMRGAYNGAPDSPKAKAVSRAEVRRKPKVQRKKEDEEIQRANSDLGRGPPMGDFSSKLNQTKGSGQPMDAATNSFMSSRFGADFSHVKIHTGSDASKMSDSIQAKAFTHQNHIYFNQGQYQPNTHGGKTLLAHELTHTIQQGAVSSGVQRSLESVNASKNGFHNHANGVLRHANGGIQPKLKVGPANDHFEKEADAMADQVMRKCAACDEEKIQRKTWEKEEEYNPYHSKSNTNRGPPTVQRAAESNAITRDHSGQIRRGFWDDPIGTVGGAISDAADAVADSLSAGIDWIKGKIADMAANMPGYKLFTVVLAKDPISGKAVDRSGRNFIEAGLDLIPDGADYKQKMEKDGGLDEAAKWLDEQMKLLDFSVSDIISDFDRFIDSLSMSDVKDPGGALDRGIRIFKPYVERVKTFAKNVAIKFLAIVKAIAIDALLEWIQKKTTLYPLLTLVIGSDPLTGETIERTGENILRAVILLQSDGQKQLTKMEENGALAEGAEWIDETIEALISIIGNLTEAFTKSWKEFKIADLLTPTETFTKIYERFSKPVEEIGNFIVRVGKKILQIVRDIVINELLEWIKNETKWYPLITVVLGEDPISGEAVERNGMNLIKGFAALHPEGEEQVRQMQESGALQKAADWIDTSIERIVNIISGLKNGFITLWETFSVTSLLYPVETFQNIYNLFKAPVSEMISFAVEVASMILQLIKDALIKRLVTFARTIPGYHLVTVILGQDVFSKEKVDRSAENIIRGFMGLIPGGEEKFQELKESGAIGEAVAWIEGAVEELDLTWDAIRGIFTEAWNRFSLSDLATPIETFARVMDLFAAPVGRVVRFVGKVIFKLVEIALRLMGFPFELIGSIISRAQTAYTEIKNDPIGFLKNILKAVKQGFTQFFGNILTHLLNGVGEWLFGQLGDTGITIPTDFSFKSILGMVFEILGITKEKIFEKLKKKVGPEKWAKIEGAIETMTGVWEFVKDVMERGPIVIWEKIQEKLTGLWDMVISAARNWIMTKIIEQVTVKLLSLLDPTGIMAVVNSFIAFFRAVQSAIEYMIPMLEMLNSFLGGVVQIAQGNIKPAADLLEKTMAQGMPIMIGFLANQVGLGRIGQKIKEIIGAIQEKVDKGIDWMIDKAWEMGARLLESIKGVTGIGTEKPLTAEERKKQLKDGQKYILQLEKELDKDKDNDLTQGEANTIASNAKNKFSVFQKITPIQDGGKWSYDYVARSKIKGSKDVDGLKYYIGKGVGAVIPNEEFAFTPDVNTAKVKPLALQGDKKYNGYVVSVRRVFDSPDKQPVEIAEMYNKQAFTPAKQAEARMAMVVGVNGIDDVAGKNRGRTLDKGSFSDFPFAVIGFLWRPRWLKASDGTAPSNFKEVSDYFKDSNDSVQKALIQEEKKAYDQAIIPYGEIMGKIAASTQASDFKHMLQDADHIGDVYIQTGDSDAVNLNAPQSESTEDQLSDANPKPLVDGLFTRYDRLLESKKNQFGQTPVLASGGYSFEFKTNQGDVLPKDAAKVLATKIDNQIRNTIASYSARGIYFPEPNTIVKVVGDNAFYLQEDSFGQGAKEGEALVQNVLKINPNATVAFDTVAKLITDSQRFEVRLDDKTEVEVNAKNVIGGLHNLSDDEVRAIFNIDQSHATPEKWKQSMTAGFNVEVEHRMAGLGEDFIREGKSEQSAGLNQAMLDCFSYLNLGEYRPDNRATLDDFNPDFKTDPNRTLQQVVGTPTSDTESAELYFDTDGIREKANDIRRTARKTGKIIKDFLLTNFYPQPKLKHTSQTSPEEKEADNIAEQIINSPIEGKLNPTGRSIQRKMKPSVKRSARFNSNNQSQSNTTGMRMLRPNNQSQQNTTGMRMLRPNNQSQQNTTGMRMLRPLEAPNAGSKMDTSTQTFMESRFGADFNNVRIHTNNKAAQMSESIQAKAFTYGNNIYFNSGQYTPGTREGKRLLAHELTHTIQQGESLVKNTVQRTPKDGEMIQNYGVLYTESAESITLFDRPLAESSESNQTLPIGSKVRVLEYQDGFYQISLYSDTGIYGYVAASDIVQAELNQEGNLIVQNEVAKVDKETFEQSYPELAAKIADIFWSYYQVGGVVESLDKPSEYKKEAHYTAMQLSYRSSLYHERRRRRSIESKEDYSGNNLFLWLEAVEEVVHDMQPILLVEKSNERSTGEAEFQLDFVKSVLIPQIESALGHEYLDVGKSDRKKRKIQKVVEQLAYEQLSPAEKALPGIIEFLLDHPVKVNATAEYVTYGATFAQLLSESGRIDNLNRYGYGFSASQIREVFVLLQNVDPVLAKEALYKGETIGWLLSNGAQSGFGDLRAEGEGLLSGLKRGYYEAMNTTEPAPFDEWGVADAVTFYFSFTPGMSAGFLLGAKDMVVGFAALFTPSFWAEMYRIFTDEAHRFDMGVGLGTALAQEIRTYQSGDPETVGWKLGVLFGKVAFEVVLTLLTSGAFQLSKVGWASSFPRLARFAETVASTKIARLAVTGARIIISKLDDLARSIRALLQRLPALTASQRMNRRIMSLESELAALLEVTDATRAMAHADELDRAATGMAGIESEVAELTQRVDEVVEVAGRSDGGTTTPSRSLTGTADERDTTRFTSSLEPDRTRGQTFEPNTDSSSIFDESPGLPDKTVTETDMQVEELLSQVDDRQLPVPVGKTPERSTRLSVIDEANLPPASQVRKPTLTWQEIQQQAAGLGLTKAEVSALWRNYKIENGIITRSVSARSAVGASNSQLTSAWRLDLYYHWEMKGLARQTPNGWEFLDIHTNQWLPADQFDLGHKVAAVEFYQIIRNKPIADQRRLMYTFMRDFDNYRPELSGSNRSSGASLGITYFGENPGYKYGESSRIPLTDQ